ncbi:MAG: PAS domain-containing protein [Planctomycetota bacterium]
MSETAKEPATVTYAIDAQDRLMRVDESWATFAESNEGGRTLRPETVIGRSLWDFVRDPQLQLCYRQLLDVVRSGDEPVEFEFRCDSPLMQRHMRMTMRSEPDGCVGFVCTTEQTIPQQRILKLANAAIAGESCRRCSLCNLFHLGEERWGEVDELIQHCNVMNRAVPPTVIWTVCEPCRDRMSALHETLRASDTEPPAA